MKTLLAILITFRLIGCATVSFDTQYGSVTYDGKTTRVAIKLPSGFTK